MVTGSISSCPNLSDCLAQHNQFFSAPFWYKCSLASSVRVGKHYGDRDNNVRLEKVLDHRALSYRGVTPVFL